MNIRPFLDPPISAASFTVCVEGAAAAQDRRVAAEGLRLAGRSVENPRFGDITPEQRREWARKGGLVRPGGTLNAKDRFGLTWDEWWDYGALRAKGLAAEAAAEAIYSRRPTKAGN